MSDEVSREQILETARAAYAANNAITIASTGGAHSPWALGAYFTHEGDSPLVFLELAGKTMANIRVNARVAYVVSANDAMQDFVQASAVAEVLMPTEYDRVMAALVTKMPWFKLYTECVPVRLKPTEVFVSSFARGWFPAKKAAF
jgi:hypothetical protein